MKTFFILIASSAVLFAQGTYLETNRVSRLVQFERVTQVTISGTNVTRTLISERLLPARTNDFRFHPATNRVGTPK